MKIALIAHDKKKNEIIELAKQYKDVLAGLTQEIMPLLLKQLSIVVSYVLS